MHVELAPKLWPPGCLKASGESVVCRVSEALNRQASREAICYRVEVLGGWCVRDSETEGAALVLQ